MFKGGKPPAFSPQDIVEFIFFPVVNEGCRVIAEGIVDKPADLDVATVLAMGFPPYRWVTQHVLILPGMRGSGLSRCGTCCQPCTASAPPCVGGCLCGCPCTN